MDINKYLEELKKRVSGYNYVLDEYEKGELEYSDGGNFDDTFELGIEVGYAQAINEIILDLQEGKESE